MTSFHGAVMPICGMEVLVVVVRPWVLADLHECQLFAFAFCTRFGKPVVLMARDERGMPLYFGRRDLVRALRALPVEVIPWQRIPYPVGASPPGDPSRDPSAAPRPGDPSVAPPPGDPSVAPPPGDPSAPRARRWMLPIAREPDDRPIGARDPRNPSQIGHTFDARRDGLTAH